MYAPRSSLTYSIRTTRRRAELRDRKPSKIRKELGEAYNLMFRIPREVSY